MKILIIGKAGSGKTTAGKYISEKYGFKTFALADNIKKFTVKMLNLCNISATLDDMYDVNKKHLYRHYMQYVSTDLCKNFFGKNCWCEMLKKNIEDSGCNKYIIDDIRFVSDYDFWFNPEEDISIKIITHRNAPNQCDKKDSVHPSELETDKINCQYTIINDGSIDDLYKQIDEIIKNKIL